MTSQQLHMVTLRKLPVCLSSVRVLIPLPAQLDPCMVLRPVLLCFLYFLLFFPFCPLLSAPCTQLPILVPECFFSTSVLLSKASEIFKVYLQINFSCFLSPPTSRSSFSPAFGPIPREGDYHCMLPTCHLGVFHFFFF